MTSRFDPSVEEILLHSGWVPNRDVGPIADQWLSEIDAGGFWQAFPAASRIVHEFGGLLIGSPGPGQDMARQQIRVDPRLAAYVRDEAAEYEHRLARKIYPIGEGEDGNYVIVVSPDERVFMIGPWLSEAGRSWNEALSNLVLGRRGSAIDEPAGRPGS
jgi:hypothetical protein